MVFRFAHSAVVGFLPPVITDPVLGPFCALGSESWLRSLASVLDCLWFVLLLLCLAALLWGLGRGLHCPVCPPCFDSQPVFSLWVSLPHVGCFLLVATSSALLDVSWKYKVGTFYIFSCLSLGLFWPEGPFHVPLVFPCLLILSNRGSHFCGWVSNTDVEWVTAQARVKAEGRRLDRLRLSFAGQTPGSWVGEAQQPRQPCPRGPPSCPGLVLGSIAAGASLLFSAPELVWPVPLWPQGCVAGFQTLLNLISLYIDCFQYKNIVTLP